MKVQPQLRQRHFGVSTKLKIFLDADSDDENEMTNTAPDPPSSEMRNIMKSRRSCLDAHSSGKINNKMDATEQFVDNLTLKM
ncbi:hypothetical protein TNCV_4172381 [Trichonephila clavipes]|nr:hypothetical protein TNCV_4172381 [Trichonephila clavipes]